tara:strand:- start:1897 stop:2166 length:270 start_codon:yes stop_codon:yes gene_type:complete
MGQYDWPELAADAQERWNKNAEFWDNYMGEDNNAFHNLLIRLATEDLLKIQPGEYVLDIACGNGNFSRHLAELGAQVVAVKMGRIGLDV